MKRVVAAVALLLTVGSPGIGLAATLRPIDQDGLNLRSGPGTTYAIVDKLADGHSLKVLGAENGWYKVQTASGGVAWAAGWVSRVSYADETAYAVVDTDILNVRKEPSLTAEILAKVKQNDSLRLLETAGDWWRIRTAAGVEGWVSAQYVKQAATPPAGQEPAPPAGGQPAPTTPQAPATPATPADPWPTPPGVSEQAPSAPPGAVPVLAPPVAPPAPRPAGPKAVTVLTASGVYTGRDVWAFDRVATVSPGDQVTYLDSAEGWVQVRTAGGTSGWVQGKALQITEGNWVYSVTAGKWTADRVTTATAAAPVSTPPAAAAAAPAAAPAPAPASRGTERVVVADPDGLRLRMSASIDAPILEVLPMGTVLEVRVRQAPWVKVTVPSGKTGWVHGDYVQPYTGEATPPTPTPAPAPKPTPVPAPAPTAPVKATLSQPKPGLLQLDLDAPGKTLGAPAASGTTLLIPFSGDGPDAYLPIRTAGVTELGLTATALKLTMESLPGWQIIRQEPGRLTLQLRPVLQAVKARELADRTVYDLTVMGPAAPVTSSAGASVTVSFPGLRADAAVLAAVPGIAVTDDGVKFTVASRRPYALKRTATGFELDLYKPGLAGKTIVLDPGHGGPDSGAVNRSLGIAEETINLQLALRLRELLAARGATVLMTRAADAAAAPPEVMKLGAADPTHAELGYRSRVANELKADLFVSIHNNCCEGSGTETYYTSGTLNGERSLYMAKLLQQIVPAGLSQTNRGAHDDLMYVTRTADAPAVLLELGFLSHPYEGLQLKKPGYQDRAAHLMLQAIEQFYSERTD